MRRSNLRQYLQAPRKLGYTRDGRWFIGMTLLVGIGAINTGNNLLYLLLGMMLGLIIVSGVLSERVLRGVSVERLPHGDLFAGVEARLSYELRNEKRFFSSFSIIVDEVEDEETRARRRRAIGLPPVPPRKKKEREAEDDPGAPTALTLRVRPGAVEAATATYTFPRRGLYRFERIELGTRFPFGFFEKSRRVEQPHEVLVYPEVRRGLSHVEQLRWRAGEEHQRAEGRGEEFYGLREYRHGDDQRTIHWKVSAKRDELVRRLFEREDTRAVSFHLFNWISPELGEDAEADALEAFERAIVATASLCAYAERQGQRFALVTLDGRVDEGGGPGQLQTALRHLALLTTRRDRDEPTIALSSGSNRQLVAHPETPAAVRARFDLVYEADRLLRDADGAGRQPAAGAAQADAADELRRAS